MVAELPPAADATRILDYLASVLSRFPDGGCVTGKDGTVLVWNRGAERILGHAARDVLGKPCEYVLQGYDDADDRCRDAGSSALGATETLEAVPSWDMRVRTKSGEQRWINVSALTLPVDHELVVVHLFSDVTATKALLSLVRDRITARYIDVPADRGPIALTPRERDILRMLAKGAETRVIAGTLRVSRATVRNHVQNIFAKLGVHNRLAAVAYATEHHLL